MLYQRVFYCQTQYLIVHRHDPLVAPFTELIIVPRSVLNGLVTALHVKLNHFSKHQLQLVIRHHFFALDLNIAIDRVSDSCHICASLKTCPNPLVKQSSKNSTETVCLSFAADVLKRNRQLVL